MPEETNLDAKQEDSSSSSTTNDVNKAADSSTEAAGQNSESKTTLESVIQDTFKASQATSEETDAESAANKVSETQEGKEEGSEKKEEASQTTESKESETKEQAEPEVGKPVPYERFVEVNTKAKEFESKVQSIEPLARAQQNVIEFCQRNEVTPDQFQNWMEIAALVNSDPAKAVEKLKPLVEQLQGFTGDKLSEDLQKAVDNGDISLDYAKRLAKAENQSKFGEKRMQQTQQSMVQQQQEQFVNQMQTSVSRWIDSKKANDPDFAPKAKETDPHGKFEFFMNEFAAQAKANAKEITTAQHLIVLAEKAYSLVSNSLKGLHPKIKQTKTLNSTSSSSSTNSAPKTVEEAMANAAKKHGLSLSASK